MVEGLPHIPALGSEQLQGGAAVEGGDVPSQLGAQLGGLLRLTCARVLELQR